MDIHRKVLQWLDEGPSCALAVYSQGATPKETGSKAIVAARRRPPAVWDNEPRPLFK